MIDLSRAGKVARLGPYKILKRDLSAIDCYFHFLSALEIGSSSLEMAFTLRNNFPTGLP